MMRIKRIPFEKLKNTRDLGGFPAGEGKAVRPGLLLRSGNLSALPENDVRKLFGEIGVKTVIDLRTPIEIKDAPDTRYEGVDFVCCPLLDNSFLGIARDEYSIETWLNLFLKNDETPSSVFERMYMKLAFDERTKEYYRRIFDILATTDSPVLWHCSAGKDRVGVTTAFILSVLGVDRRLIVKDYERTRHFTFPEILKIYILGSLKYRNRRISSAIRVLMDVDGRYIERIFDTMEREYGSVESYLINECGVPQENIDLIRRKYLK